MPPVDSRKGEDSCFCSGDVPERSLPQLRRQEPPPASSRRSSPAPSQRSIPSPSLLMADGQVQLNITNQPVSPQRRRYTIMDIYRLCLHSTSGKISEALVVLNNLLDVLGGKDNREELMDAIKDFLNPGNILEICSGELCGLRPSPEDMCRKADELLKMYRDMKNDWMLVVVYIFSAMIMWGIIYLFCRKVFHLHEILFLSGAVIASVLYTADIYRKAKEDAIEKKIKGVTKVREVASSCCFIQEDLKAISHAFKQLMVKVELVKNQMKPTQDNRGDNTVGNELSLSKCVRDVAKEARQMKKKMEKMEKDMEKAENLVVEAISDTSFMDVDEELAAVFAKS